MSDLIPSNNRLPQLGAHFSFPDGNGLEDPALEPERVPLKEYLGTLRRHAWLVLAVTLLCGGLAAYKAYTDPPVFFAGAVIRLKDNTKTMAGSLAGPMVGGSGYGNPILSQLQVLRSRSVIGRVVDGEGLRLQVASEGFQRSDLHDAVVAPETTLDSLTLEFTDGEVVVRAAGERVSAPYGVPVQVGGVSFSVPARPKASRATLVIAPRDQAAAGLLGQLETRPRDNTDVIDVGFYANDPIVAQRVVNSVVEAFQDYNATVEQQQARRRRAFVEQQLQYADSVLRDAQAELTAFRQRENVFSSQQRFSAEQLSMAQLETQIAQLEAERKMFQALLPRLQDTRRTGTTDLSRTLISTPSMAANPAVVQLFGLLTQYQTQRDSITSGPAASAETSPEVQRLDALITRTQGQLVGAVRSGMAALEAQLAMLRELQGRNVASTQRLAGTEAEEARILARVDYLSGAAKDLREEYQRAKIAEAVEGGQVEIVDSALPGAPVQSGRIRTLLFGLAFGLLLGGGGAILLENMNSSIRRKDEIEKLLRIPELAIVPAIHGPGKTVKRLGLPAAVFNGNGKVNGNGKQPAAMPGHELVAATQVQSPGAEAYRTLRTNLIFSQSISQLRRMVVTSSAPGEGKSTTASNLAVTFAQQGMRVLLVDCDLRKARLHKVFQVPREPGFTHLLLGLKPLDEVVRGTSVEGLSFLPSGTLPPNPAELLGGEAMRRTLDRLSESFDLVILDTPPLLAASDAAILGRQVDGVLLVIRAGATERDAAKQSLQKLVAVGARVLGAVLNDPDSKVAQYGGYYHYEYYGETV